MFHIVKKFCLRESYDAHSKTTCSADSLQTPQLRHSRDPHLLSRLPKSAKGSWVPEGNLKSILEEGLFTCFKYSLSPIPCYNSLLTRNLNLYCKAISNSSQSLLFRAPSFCFISKILLWRFNFFFKELTWASQNFSGQPLLFTLFHSFDNNLVFHHSHA